MSGDGRADAPADNKNDNVRRQALRLTIRKITPAGTHWVVTTIGGLAGQAGSDDGLNSAARFNGPSLLTVDSHGTLFLPDQGNSTIRMGVPLPAMQRVSFYRAIVVLP